MTIAVIIIALCELIRVYQNTLQLLMMRKDTTSRDNAYSEFIKSLKMQDREFIKKIRRDICTKEV